MSRKLLLIGSMTFLIGVGALVASFQIHSGGEGEIFFKLKEIFQIVFHSRYSNCRGCPYPHKFYPFWMAHMWRQKQTQEKSFEEQKSDEEAK